MAIAKNKKNQRPEFRKAIDAELAGMEEFAVRFTEYI